MLRKRFVNPTGYEQNSSDNKRRNGLCVRPLIRQIIGPLCNMGLKLMLTICLTKVKANQQTHDASDEADESNEIEFSKLFPNWATLMWIKVQEKKEYNCCEATGGPGDGCQWANSQRKKASIQVDEEAPSPRDVFCKYLRFKTCKQTTGSAKTRKLTPPRSGPTTLEGSFNQQMG